MFPKNGKARGLCFSVVLGLIAGCTGQLRQDTTSKCNLPESAQLLSCPVGHKGVVFYRANFFFLMPVEAILHLQHRGWSEGELPLEDMARATGSPIQRGYRLFANIGDVRHELTSIADLRWLVEVRTEEQALAYVRFLSDLEIYYLIDFGALEVSPANGKPSDYGEIDADEWTRLGLHPPRATRMKHGFTIERFLIVDEPWTIQLPQRIIQVEEFVGVDGFYLRRVKRTIVLDPDRSLIAVPYYL